MEKYFLVLLLIFVYSKKTFSQHRIADVPYTEFNFEDLSFLKEELKEKSIVCLGEEWHFTETFSQLKNRIVKYLHIELGYNIILFESSFQGSWIVELDRLEGKERLFESVQTIWRTESVLDLMNYLSESKNGDAPITQYGFDLYGTYTSRFEKKLSKYLKTNTALGELILPIENKFRQEFISKTKTFKKYKSGVTEEDIQVYKNLLFYVLKDTQTFSSEEEKSYFIRTIENRILLGQSLFKEQKYFREEVMAKNIEWILERKKKDDKVIIWAADIHISKSQKKTVKDGDRSMIERLPKKFKPQVYSLSLIPISSAAKKLKKELNGDSDRFFFFSHAEENEMNSKKEEFDGTIICKSVESIEQYKVN